VSWSNGFFSVGVRWGGGYGGGYYPGRCCGGYYGGGYRGGYHGGNTVINTGDINIGNSVSVGNRNKARNSIERNSNGGFDRSRGNLYNRDANRARNANRATNQRDRALARPASSRKNDVFADRSGNVARRANGSWETRQNGQWKQNRWDQSTTPGQSRNRAQTGRSTTNMDRGGFNAGRIDRGGLNRASQSRQRGASRQAARPARGRR